jgi:hypothetical protein
VPALRPVEDAQEQSAILDTRLTTPARLDEAFARRAMKKARRQTD